jgi:hypothetical protein
VILEHLVLGLHTCLVPVFLPSSLLLCIPCLGSALQYTPLRLLSAFIHLVCILSTSILASLHCTCFVIARQIFPCVVDIQGKPHHRPHRTLQPTDRNTSGSNSNLTGGPCNRCHHSPSPPCALSGIPPAISTAMTQSTSPLRPCVPPPFLTVSLSVATHYKRTLDMYQS